MKTYHVTATAVTIQRGRLRLSADQAARRSHALKALDEKKGLYELTGPTMFKRGEVFGHDGDANKALLREMEEAPGEPVGTRPPGRPKGLAAVKDRVKETFKKAGKETDPPAEEPAAEPAE